MLPRYRLAGERGGCAGAEWNAGERCEDDADDDDEAACDACDAGADQCRMRDLVAFVSASWCCGPAISASIWRPRAACMSVDAEGCVWCRSPKGEPVDQLEDAGRGEAGAGAADGYRSRCCRRRVSLRAS